MAAGPPLGQPQVGGLSPGDFVIVHYDVAEDVWHTRLLLAHVSLDSWVILTPDGDLYIEEFSSRNADISAWRVFDPAGPVPYGVDARTIYRFRNLPDAAAMRRLQDEGGRHAAQERARLGGGGGAAVPAGGVAPGGAPGGLANIAGGAAAVGGGNAALAADLGGGGAGAAIAGGNADQGGDDARTLSISRDETGARFKEFRGAVTEAKPMEFKDWPVAGPRTTKHVILQMIDHGGSAIGHHQAWRVACKFQPSDGPAMEHEAWCKVLQSLMVYDQLDVTNLAGAELIVRAIQRIEEKHKWKLSSAEDAGEGSLFMGASGGSRAGSVVSPKLTEWIGTEMQKEALVAKERRKAREERALSRKGDKEKDAK